MESLIHSPGVGWQQTSTDLAELLDDHHGAALGIFDSSTGALLCQAMLPSFCPGGDQFWGWLAYVATAPEARRRGLATSLVSALLASGTGSPSVGVPICWCAVQARGYVLGRAIFPSGLFLGPLVARDPADAEALLRAALDAAPNDAPVQMLLPHVWTSPAAPSADREGAGWKWDGCFESSFADALVRRLGFERLGESVQLMVRGSSAGVPWMGTWSLAEVSKGAARPFAATGYEFG